jgi:hypothetical protein
MATGRRHYFFVADAIGHEPWSTEQVGQLVLLMAHLHERWARDGLTPEQACECLLSRADAMRISGKHRPDIASMSLRRLADIASISVERRGDITAIKWPKFAEFQMLRTRTPPDERPSNALSGPGPGPGPTERKERETIVSPKKDDDRPEITPPDPPTLTLIPPAPKPKKPKPPKPAAARRVPLEFDLEPDRLAFATAHGLTVAEAERQFDAMCDHEFAAPRSDWNAVWRNWVREYLERRPKLLQRR